MDSFLFSSNSFVVTCMSPSSVCVHQTYIDPSLPWQNENMNLTRESVLVCHKIHLPLDSMCGTRVSDFLHHTTSIFLLPVWKNWSELEDGTLPSLLGHPRSLPFFVWHQILLLKVSTLYPGLLCTNSSCTVTQFVFPTQKRTSTS